jgi:hypothetical protein
VNPDEPCGCCEGAGVMPCRCSEPCDCVGGFHDCGDCGGEGTEEAAQRRFEHARAAQAWSDWGTRLAPVLAEDDAA